VKNFTPREPYASGGGLLMAPMNAPRLFKSYRWDRYGSAVLSCYTVYALNRLRRRYDRKLSYREQIARKLRTQYVEGIYNNSVTLKSRFRVTQGHWKWHHL